MTGGGDGAVKFWDLQNGGVAVDNLFEVDGQNITHIFKVMLWMGKKQGQATCCCRMIICLL